MKTTNDYRLTAISLAILVFAALALISANATQEAVYSKAFWLVDDNKKIRGGFHFTNLGNPAIFLCDQDGNVLINISSDRANKASISFLRDNKIISLFTTSSWLLEDGDAALIITIPPGSNKASLLLQDKGKTFWSAP